MNRIIIISFALLALIAIFFSLIGCHKKIEVESNPVASTIKTGKPVLKVFIENSGSMDGYMCDGSQLKDAVYDYVSDLNRHTKSTKLYYINSAIIPYNGNLTAYIKDLNPTSFHQAGGDTSNTDLGDLIARILETVNDSTVSIFVSDCILDLPSKNAAKFLTICKIRIKDEVVNAQKRIPNLGVEILKLSSDFNGKYFHPDGTVELLKNVKRPYYIWIFGDKNYLAKLNTEVPISMLNKYGLEGIVAFSNQSKIPYDVTNRAKTGKIINSSRGGYKITIRADFRTTLQSDIAILDKNNYKFNNANLILEGIYPIKDDKSEYTHFMNFTIPEGTQLVEDCLTLNAPPMPNWVTESNDDSDVIISKNLNKTIGIKYLIQGVAASYLNETVCTKMNFNIKHR